MKLKLLATVRCATTGNVIEDDVEVCDIQAALDRAVDFQKTNGMQRDRPSVTLSSKTITIEESEDETH